MNKNLKKNFVWNTIGLSLNAFNSLFFLIVVKFFNGTDDAGIFSYSFSICALLYVIATFYTRTYQIANYNNTKKISDFITFRLAACISCFIIAAIFCLASHFDFYKTSIILAILLFRIIEAISDCFYGFIQENERLYNVGISLSAKAIAGLACLILTDLLTHNLLLSITSIVIVNLLFFIFYDLSIFKKIKKGNIIKLSTKRFTLILRESFTIFLFTFLLIYMANAQKYILTYSSTNEEQMIFGILIMPSTMLSLIGNYLLMPFMTSLTRNIKEKKFIAYKTLARKILISMAIIGIIGLAFTYLFGIPLLSFIYQYDLSPYSYELLIIILASIISAIAIMISNFLVLLNKNKMQLVLYIVASILATIISVIFINKYKILGASISYLISYAFLLVTYLTYYELIIKKLEKK